MTKRKDQLDQLHELDEQIAELMEGLSEPPEYQIALGLRQTLARCVRWRKLIKAGPRVIEGVTYDVAYLTMVLKKNQMILLRLRIWRATGKYPDEH